MTAYERVYNVDESTLKMAPEGDGLMMHLQGTKIVFTLEGVKELNKTIIRYLNERPIGSLSSRKMIDGN